MLIGYMRVSKSDGSQVLDLQKDALIKAGVEKENIFSDMASGRHDDRLGLKECMKFLREGDVLVVYALDRIARSLKHTIQIVEELKTKGTELKILSGAASIIDTTTPQGKFSFTIFAALAELEVELIRERTRAGLAAARARGRNGGRPRKIDASALRMCISGLKDGLTMKDVAAKFGVTHDLLYHYLNSDGSLKEKGQHIIDREENEQK